MTYTYTSQKQVRAAFWQGNEHLRSMYRSGKSQNDYNATIRTEFVDFVDMLARDKHISETLANRVTL
jgi:hypothetical protein